HFAGYWIAGSLLPGPRRAQPPHVGHQPPDLGLRQARARHLRAGNTAANGSVKLAVGAAVAILTSGEVHAAPALALLPVAMGAMAQKVLLPASRVSRRIEGILFRDFFLGLPAFLSCQRQQTKEEADSNPEERVHSSSRIIQHFYSIAGCRHCAPKGQITSW